MGPEALDFPENCGTDARRIVRVKLRVGEVAVRVLGSDAAIVDRARALPILEPMTGNLNDLSPYVRAGRTRAMRDECRAVADRYAGRNDAVASAFDAMARFADERLRDGRFDPLPAS